MKAKFDVQMNQKVMYNFLMRHTYTSFPGFFSIIVGVIVLTVFFTTRGEVEASKSMVYGVFGVIFLLYLPVSLYIRAVQQVKMNPVNKKPLSYTIDEKGIVSAQGDKRSAVQWDQVLKVRETRLSVLVYTGKMYCFVLPKKAMGSNTAVVKTLIRENVAPRKVKMHGN